MPPEGEFEGEVIAQPR